MKFLIEKWKALNNWRETNLLFADGLFALGSVGLLLGLCARYWSMAEVSDLFNANRASIYGALAGIAGSMLGFVLTAMSIIMVFGGMKKLSLLKTSGQYEQIFRVFIHATYALAFCTIWSLLAIVLDKDASPIRFVTLATIPICAFVAVRVYRCIWVLQKMVDAVSRSPRE